MLSEKQQTINQLRRDILSMQGHTPPATNNGHTFGLGPIETAFPNGIFPVGAIHEFICEKPEHAAASGGFISGILGKLMTGGGACLWISRLRTVFPPALKVFGVKPDRIIFVSLPSEKDVLWAMEEALKCEGLAAVACELSQINFAQSRRLALAVEQSKVTGFVVISDFRKIEATASAARWRIKPLPSLLEKGMPGVGFPRWQVELLKVRNGRVGTFQLGWKAGSFIQDRQDNIPEEVLKQRKAG